jgi:hypothetical protein
MPIKSKGVKKSRKTAPRNLAAADKQAQAMKMRLEGESFAVIADKVGYASASGAWHAVQAGLSTTLSEPSQELRELELARLDLMWKSLLPKIRKGVASAVIGGIHVVQQRARLLGLYAPKGILLRVENPAGMSDEELIAYCIRSGTPLLPGLEELYLQIQAQAAATPAHPSPPPPPHPPITTTATPATPAPEAR